MMWRVPVNSINGFTHNNDESSVEDFSIGLPG